MNLICSVGTTGSSVSLRYDFSVASPPHSSQLSGCDRPSRCVEHHFLVVAQQRHELAALAQFQQLLDDAAAVRPAIDAVAQA